MHAQHFNFAPELFQNRNFSAPKFAFWTNIFRQEGIFIIFRQLKIQNGRQPSLHHLLATTLLLVNRIKSEFFQIKSNRICCQPNRPPLLGRHQGARQANSD